jgi:hypothetical protein
MIETIESHCKTLTEKEEILFIQRMKTLFDDKVSKIADAEKEDTVDERKILDRYDLFRKQNYFKHFLYKILCDVLLSAGKGYIYGGLIRDNILHDYMAEQFYEKNYGSTFDVYNDPKIDKETSLRTLVPTDIDVLFHTHQNYEYFLTKIRLLGYIINYGSSEDGYITPQKEGELCSRFKLEITSNVGIRDLNSDNPRFIDKDFVSLFIIVDVTIAGVYVPSYDFLCNSLILSRDGFVFREAHVFDSVKSFIKDKETHLEHVKAIEEQIHRMEAVIMSEHFNTSPVPLKHRVLKMVRKGWLIKYVDSHRSDRFLVQRDDDEDCCIVCREKFTEVADVPGMHKLYDGFKFSCCSAVYHPVCLIELLKKSRHGIRVDTNFLRYQCIQCSEFSMKFFWEKMEEFLNVVQESWEDINLYYK